MSAERAITEVVGQEILDSRGNPTVEVEVTLAGGATATPEQIEAMVLSAVALSERFYPAFQLAGWGEEDAETAMMIAIDEAYGTA